MENVKYTIYKLIDPMTNEIRYIGLTFNDLKQRLKSHCSEKSKSHKSNWVQSLIKQGLKPIIESIEDNILSYDEVCEREIFYINKYKSEGYRLTNMASGGNKNKKMSYETRNKMSNSAKNRNFRLVLSEDVKKTISDKAKKRFENQFERERLKISNKKYEDSKTKEQKLKDILIQDVKSVLQYDKDMIFISEYISIRDAERKTNINRSNITKCCKNKVKSAGGFIWKFREF